MGPHVFNRAAGSGKSNELTDFVHSRIEECMQIYMSKEETVKLIFDTFGIKPKLIRSIWYLLEKANPDFFSWFKTHCEKITNASTSNSDEDLAEASTSYTEPDNKTRARRSMSQKEKKLQLLLLSSIVTETASNDASSPMPQEASTANAGDAPIPVEKISSKAKRSKARKKAKKQKQQAPGSPSTEVERAEESQESIPSADGEIILKEISTSLCQLESIIGPVHKLLSNGFVPLRSATKALKGTSER